MFGKQPSLTKYGKNLLVRALSGETITFTRFGIGSGSLPPGETEEEQSELITSVLTFQIDEVDRQEGLIALTGHFDSSLVVEDFWWRELCVYAHGEDQEEIMYAYANDGDNSGVVRKETGDVMTIQDVTMVIAIGDAENVEAVYSPWPLYATKEEFDQHVDDDDNPHKVTLGQIAEVGTYTGDGTSKRGINLGFVPSAIILSDEWGGTWNDTDGVTGGMAVGQYGIRSRDSSSSTDATTWSNQYTALLPGEDSGNDFAGFWVNYYSGSSAEENISTNKSGVLYHYIAFR